MQKLIERIGLPLLILLVLTPFTGAIYYINEQNQYVRGKFFLLWHGSTILVFIFILAVLVMYRNKMQRFLRQIIATTTVIPICGSLFWICGQSARDRCRADHREEVWQDCYKNGRNRL